MSFWNGSGNVIGLRTEMETVLLVREAEAKVNKKFSRKRKGRRVEEKQEAIVICVAEFNDEDIIIVVRHEISCVDLSKSGC